MTNAASSTSAGVATRTVTVTAPVGGVGSFAKALRDWVCSDCGTGIGVNSGASATAAGMNGRPGTNSPAGTNSARGLLRMTGCCGCSCACGCACGGSSRKFR